MLKSRGVHNPECEFHPIRRLRIARCLERESAPHERRIPSGLNPRIRRRHRLSGLADVICGLIIRGSKPNLPISRTEVSTSSDGARLYYPVVSGLHIQRDPHDLVIMPDTKDVIMKPPYITEKNSSLLGVSDFFSCTSSRNPIQEYFANHRYFYKNPPFRFVYNIDNTSAPYAQG